MCGFYVPSICNFFFKFDSFVDIQSIPPHMCTCTDAHKHFHSLNKYGHDYNNVSNNNVNSNVRVLILCH